MTAYTHDHGSVLLDSLTDEQVENLFNALVEDLGDQFARMKDALSAVAGAPFPDLAGQRDPVAVIRAWVQANTTREGVSS